MRGLLTYVKNKLTLLATITAAIIVGGITTHVVMASIPDSYGIIHSCRLNATGSVRIIDSASQSCNGLETALNWNQSGGLVSNLVGADFSGAGLWYRNFAWADLHTSNFNGTTLTGSDFSHANLSDITLEGTGTKANKVNFSNADFSGAQIGGPVSVELTDSVFSGADFTDATIGGGASGNAIFTSGDFQSANLANVTFYGAVFQGSNFHAVDFRNSVFQSLSFTTSANLSNANFSGKTLDNSFGINASNVSNTNFNNGHIHGGSIENSTNASGANFTNVDFVDAYLDGTDLSGATLTGATWSNTMCPDTSMSGDHGNTCIGHLTP